MKRKIFTLLMMFALVIVAGNVFALNETTPLGGGTYTYKLNNIATTHAATVSATYEVTSGQVATVNSIYYNQMPDQTSPAPTPITSLSALSTGYLSFTVTYGTETTPAVNGNIKVTIDESGDGGCSNYILLAITVQAVPSLTLNVSTTSGGCQDALATAPTTGSADAYSGANNTVTFTVAQGTTLAGVASYAYTLDVTGGPTGGGLTGGGSQTTIGTKTATFTTTEGAGFNVDGEISSSATHTFTMDAAHGGGTYTFTIGTPGQAAYKSLPTIGVFGD